ncbi:MAG TPA: recombination mediator RecR [Candidatus Wallbacteria bacterium]|nr:recombination mediator RecR [Candidatus Wallbacteria bacterium]
MSLTPSLDRLIHELQKLPGVGPKNAQRLAIFIFKKGADFSRALSSAILEMSRSVKYCSSCAGICESDVCDICSNSLRDHSKVCVVEKPTDVFHIEATGQYNGVYHVLNGLISPLEYLTIDKLNIKPLIARINSADCPVCEIVFALPPKVEGDATMALIKKMIQKPLKISKLAQGIPTGCEIEHIDSMTLARALNNRN